MQLIKSVLILTAGVACVVVLETVYRLVMTVAAHGAQALIHMVF